MTRLLAALVLVLSFSASALAHDIQPLFNALKDYPKDYTVTGTICEQVARLSLKPQFPESEYDIQNGVVYYGNGRVIGELDVVVFRRADQKAVMVGEVKCWKSLSGARHKAAEQRARFLDNLRAGTRLDFYNSDHKEIHYQPAQFAGLQTFISISQEGGVRAGFDMELSYSLEEMMSLREMLMSCQQRGECARAN